MTFKGRVGLRLWVRNERCGDLRHSSLDLHRAGTNSSVEPDANPLTWAVLAQAGTVGPTGPAGPAASIAIGTITTGPPGRPRR